MALPPAQSAGGHPNVQQPPVPLVMVESVAAKALGIVPTDVRTPPQFSSDLELSLLGIIDEADSGPSEAEAEPATPMAVAMPFTETPPPTLPPPPAMGFNAEDYAAYTPRTPQTPQRRGNVSVGSLSNSPASSTTSMISTPSPTLSSSSSRSSVRRRSPRSSGALAADSLQKLLVRIAQPVPLAASAAITGFPPLEIIPVEFVWGLREELLSRGLQCSLVLEGPAAAAVIRDGQVDANQLDFAFCLPTISREDICKAKDAVLTCVANLLPPKYASIDHHMLAAAYVQRMFFRGPDSPPEEANALFTLVPCTDDVRELNITFTRCGPSLTSAQGLPVYFPSAAGPKIDLTSLGLRTFVRALRCKGNVIEDAENVPKVLYRINPRRNSVVRRRLLAGSPSSHALQNNNSNTNTQQRSKPTQSGCSTLRQYAGKLAETTRAMICCPCITTSHPPPQQQQQGQATNTNTTAPIASTQPRPLVLQSSL